MKPTNRKPAENGEQLSPELASLLRTEGLGLPRTAAEVAAAENWLAENPMTLPASLMDANAVFRTSKLLRFPTKTVPSGVTEHLARAARDGAKISPEIEERMREERERLERERKPRKE